MVAVATGVGVPAPAAEPRLAALGTAPARHAALSTSADHGVDPWRLTTATLLTSLGGRHLRQRLRELLIVRLGWATASAYEWTQHWRVARGLAVTDEELLAVRDWPDTDVFGPVERAVLRAVDNVLANGAVSEHTWRQCQEHLDGDATLLELVAAIGAWQLVSVLRRSVQVPLEEGVVGWPPDGRRPH